MTSVVRRREQEDSGEFSDASQDIEHNNSLNDGQQESDYDSQGSDSGSERDPDNQETERRVDDDEDRSNPQYIPKRGTFYEHDDRTAASGEETTNTASETASEKKEGSETPAERRRPPRKSEIVNKWSHDKYNENEQMPKTRDELVSIYGYDIRNEDAPPHARRNRRYGRGPNKYTRTWEDEEAYRRQNAAQPRKPPNPEDFPELEASVRRQGKPRTPRPRSKSQPTSNESLDKTPPLRRNASIKTPKPKPAAKPTPNKNAAPANKNPPKPQQQEKKLPPLENLTITTTLNNSQGPGQGPRKVNATVAQQRPVPTDLATKHNHAQQQQSNSLPNKTPPNQPAPQQQHKPQQNQQPQLQAGPEARGGSKRYSSLRQRPLAEPYTPQPQPQTQPQVPQQQKPQQQSQQLPQQLPQPQKPQQQPQQLPQPQPPPQPQQPNQQRYHGAGEFAGAAPAQPAPHPQHIIHQQMQRGAHVPTPPHQPPHPPHPPHPPPPHAQQQVRLGILDQQQIVPHQHHTMHTLPQPHNIGQLQPSQGYAPPAIMPAQYMQSGNAGVYAAAPMFAQPPPPAPYSHPQIYPHHNYATQAGGVTYYDCTGQEQLPRAQRRPTAAIPIVRPQAPDRPANSSEKDNIDRIVENMFVRKPWPATPGDKDKPSENRNSQEPPSKESSQPNSLTSSSISTDSKPSESREEKVEETKGETQELPQESIADA